ncbi:7 transmembrane receptor (rhodopsin family) domain-containing protein [Ditylenchus destructor]|uniref:7 transmembrane receptor (Rhodopsin family) domain-containing protein n=1 Tax=Ditylenchus destructor TaxID=166010 RepID=A0AAD4R6V4_9BILA|nr:7 transmembrane receptor (rhodopsin family) domain-containing protein [Ditylenchus destructor]
MLYNASTTSFGLLSHSIANYSPNSLAYASHRHNSGFAMKRLENIYPLLAHNITINCTGKKAITDLFVTKTLFLLGYLTIFLTSFFGNSLVVYVVLSSRHMQTVTNIFITNLAAADLLVCCTSLWLTPVYTYLGHWIWGDWLCYGLPLFQGTSIFISTLTLMSIAVDRYFVICRQSKSVVNINDHMSMQVCIAIITLIWMVSLLLVMPYAVHMRMAYVQKPCDFWLCIEDWAMEDLKSLYGIIVVSLQFIVPFGIIGYSYVRIWRFLNKRQSLVSERESEHETQRRTRLLRMLITMVVLFAICWLPFNLLNILRDLKMDRRLKPYFSFLFLTAHLISMTATMCNPILYAWMNQSFREEFVRAVPILAKICGTRRASGSHASSRPRIITDCAPASNRRNCGDNVIDRKLTFTTSGFGTPNTSLLMRNSITENQHSSSGFELSSVNGHASKKPNEPTNSPRCSLAVESRRKNILPPTMRRSKSASTVVCWQTNSKENIAIHSKRNNEQEEEINLLNSDCNGEMRQKPTLFWKVLTNKLSRRIQ